jgi:hypothetical protein
MDAVIKQTQIYMVDFLEEMRRRNPLMFNLGSANLALAALMAVIAPFDERTVTGINPWIKPMKFAISITIFCYTMAWILGELPAAEKVKRRLNWTMAWAMIIEIALIVMQAGRGVPSHFNDRTSFDLAVFAVMGTAITLNTVAAAYMTIKFWTTESRLSPALLWGIRMGLTIFVLASLEGFLMARLRAHSVGVPDGGPGLPLLNWSTQGGDLRSAHFFGLHALQALPLIGYLFSTVRGFSEKRNPTRWVQALSLGYGAIALFLLLWALMGKSLFPQ